MKRLKIFLLVLLLLSPVVLAQDVSKRGTTAASFLSISQGARATAMGSAFVGLANDASAIYWNPAGIADLKGTQVMFDHTNWIANIYYNFVAATYDLGDMGTIGVSFTNSDYGDMNVTTIDDPEGTGELFTATDAVISVAYAINLTDNFAIGFNPKLVYQSLWKMDASAFAMDIGVKYRTPFDGIILAMSITNFGNKMQLLGTSNLVLYDQDQSSTGNNDEIPSYLETGKWSLPLTFRVGLAYSFNVSDMHKFNVALDALHPSDDYESVNVGGEYAFNNFIFLRGGYKSLFLEDSEQGFTLGFGVNQQLLDNMSIKVDYAYQDFGRLSDIQKFTIGLSF